MKSLRASEFTICIHGRFVDKNKIYFRLLFLLTEQTIWVSVKTVNGKLRFEVLKRDEFRCVYCGRGASEVAIEVDHIVPRKLGGLDVIENLAACCRECNSGKRARPIASAPVGVLKQIEVDENLLKNRISDAAAVVEEYKAAKRRAIQRYKMFRSKYCELFEIDPKPMLPHEIQENINDVVTKFEDYGLSFDELIDALIITKRACDKRRLDEDDKEACFRYLFAVCWNKVKALREGQKNGKETKC